MLRNDMKKKLQAGDRIYGTMLQEMINPTAAQIFKRAGFDFFMIDCEHGPYDQGSVRNILRVGRLEEISSLVRVRKLEYSLIAG